MRLVRLERRVAPKEVLSVVRNTLGSYNVVGSGFPKVGSYVLTSGPAFERQREKYDMIAVSSTIRRFPLPFPMGLGTFYIDSDGREKFLKD